MDIIKERFTWGLTVGLILLFLSWNSGRKDKKYLKNEAKRIKAENADLQNHLSTQLKINAKGNETLQNQLNDMRERNEKLRVNIEKIQQQPGKSEQRKLEIMETAVSTMREQAPGFAAAWEKSMRLAEEDFQQAESGFKKLIHKMVPNLRSTPAISMSKGVENSVDIESNKNR